MYELRLNKTETIVISWPSVEHLQRISGFMAFPNAHSTNTLKLFNVSRCLIHQQLNENHFFWMMLFGTIKISIAAHITT